MKKFLIFIVLFLMFVSSQSQTLQQPQSCYFMPQQGSNVLVYFYSQSNCNSSSVIESFVESISPTPQKGCVPFSNNLCKNAWQAFISSEVKSMKLLEFLPSETGENPSWEAYFYLTDNCNGEPVKAIYITDLSLINELQSKYNCNPTTCVQDLQTCLKNAQCYSAKSGSDCFYAVKNQLNSPTLQFCGITSFPPLNLQGLSLIALLFNFTLLGIIYAIAELSNSSSIKAFIKTEYFEAIKGAILLVGIFSFISVLNSLLLPLTGEQDLVNAACNKALYILKGTSGQVGIENIMQSVFDYAFTLGILAPFSLTFGIGAQLGFGKIGIGINDIVTGKFMPSSIIEWSSPPSKFTLINFIINDPVYGIENSFLISIGRVILLTLTPALVFQFLIPIGLFLRSFPIVRKIGGFFIALAIALLVIYPSLVLFIDYPFLGSINNAVAHLSNPLSPPHLEITIPILNIKVDIGFFIAPFFGLISLLVYSPVASAFGVLLDSINSLYLALNYMLSAIAANIAQMVVVVIDLFIIYTLLLDLSNIIGGKLTIAGREISGFGFLKL